MQVLKVHNADNLIGVSRENAAKRSSTKLTTRVLQVPNKPIAYLQTTTEPPTVFPYVNAQIIERQAKMANTYD